MQHSKGSAKHVTGIVLAVGLFAAADSYAHIFLLAREHGWDMVSSAMLPLGGDGVIAAASQVMLTAARKDIDIPARARLTFWLGLAATLAANAAYGLPHGRTAALLALWPVAAYMGAMEMMTWMQQHLHGQPKKNATRSASAAAAKPATEAATKIAIQAPTATPAGVTPDDELDERRRIRAPKRPLHELLAEAEGKFADVKTGAKLPGQRKIATTMGVGYGTVDLILRHLEKLQGTAASLSFA